MRPIQVVRFFIALIIAIAVVRTIIFTVELIVNGELPTLIRLVFGIVIAFVLGWISEPWVVSGSRKDKDK